MADNTDTNKNEDDKKDAAATRPSTSTRRSSAAKSTAQSKAAPKAEDKKDDEPKGDADAFPENTNVPGYKDPADEPPAPTAEEAKAASDAIIESPPDPLDMHDDRSMNVADAQGSGAIRAEYVAAQDGTSTDLSHYGFQISQFSGQGSILDSLASPPPAAVAAERAVEVSQGIVRSDERVDEQPPTPSTVDTTGDVPIDPSKDASDEDKK